MPTMREFLLNKFTNAHARSTKYTRENIADENVNSMQIFTLELKI